MFVTISFEDLGSGHGIGYVTLPRKSDGAINPRLKTIEIEGTQVMADVDQKTDRIFGLELMDDDAAYLSQHLRAGSETVRTLRIAKNRALIRNRDGFIGFWIAAAIPQSFAETHGIRLCFAEPDQRGLVGIEYIDTNRYGIETILLEAVHRPN